MFVVMLSVPSVSVGLSFNFQRNFEVNPPAFSQYSVLFLYRGK
jgi:hypothetical protein